MSINKFEESYRDFKYLRERGFPEKASLKLVGDRYRLTRMGRNCLFRGAIEEPIAQRRREKIARAEELVRAPLGLDWYNILITVESYLKGAVLFLADDGMLRDSSAVHGSFRETAVTEKAIAAILQCVGVLAPRRIDAYLDSPIRFSGDMAERVRVRLAEVGGISREVLLVHSADYPLKAYDGIVASSDSVVLDAARRVFDLPRYLLESLFGFIPLTLPELARSSHEGSGQWFESENPAR